MLQGFVENLKISAKIYLSLFPLWRTKDISQYQFNRWNKFEQQFYSKQMILNLMLAKSFK
jgi:hypothetical protein